MKLLTAFPGLFATGLFLFVSGAASSHAGELQMRVNNTQGEPMPDVVIEVIAPRLPVPEDWPRTGTVDQVNKEFVRPVIAVVENSVVSFPNSDDIHHHVYSFSDTKRFELPLYTGNTAQPVLFEKAGIVTIGCNIHDWMVGYIYVGQSHLTAVTDAQGSGIISGLEAGSYTLRLWHAGIRPGQALPETTVVVNADGISEHNITLDSQPVMPLRRAPLPGMRTY